MIPAAILPPQLVDNAGGAAAMSGQEASADDTANTPFDAILSLEALAATCAALDSGASELPDLEGLGEKGSEGDDPDGDDDGDAQGPLAFLASLFSLAPVPAQSAAAAGSSSDGGHAERADESLMPILLAGKEGAASDAADVALAGKVIDAMASNDPQADPGASVSRVAEMLSHAPRHATAAAAGDGILTPVRDPRWAEDLGTRVAMMVKGAESSASLQLTPVDLGPLDVSVTVKDSQATIHFGAAHAETRALLEASIPRLREMLAAQGFNLLDASVSQGFSRSHRPEAPSLSRGHADSEVESVTPSRIVANGLLDLYA